MSAKRQMQHWIVSGVGIVVAIVALFFGRWIIGAFFLVVAAFVFLARPHFDPAESPGTGPFGDGGGDGGDGGGN